MHSNIGRSDPVLGLLCTESEKLTSQSNSVEVHSVLLHCLALLLKSMWSPVMDWHDRCTSICHSATPGPAVVHVRQRTAARVTDDMNRLTDGKQKSKIWSAIWNSACRLHGGTAVGGAVSQVRGAGLNCNLKSCQCKVYTFSQTEWVSFLWTGFIPVLKTR